MCRGLDSLPASCLERAKELKALIRSFLQRSDPGGKNNNKLRLKADEPLQWKGSFEQLLASQNGRFLFRAFLVSEFSEENMAFYLACQDYRTTKPSQLASKAQKIYDRFIGADAPCEVNLDHVTKAATKDNIENPGESSFDLAQAEIYTLMEKDCYPRFLKSATYLEVSRAARTG